MPVVLNPPIPSHQPQQKFLILCCACRAKAYGTTQSGFQTPLCIPIPPWVTFQSSTYTTHPIRPPLPTQTLSTRTLRTESPDVLNSDMEPFEQFRQKFYNSCEEGKVHLWRGRFRTVKRGKFRNIKEVRKLLELSEYQKHHIPYFYVFSGSAKMILGENMPGAELDFHIAEQYHAQNNSQLRIELNQELAYYNYLTGNYDKALRRYQEEYLKHIPEGSYNIVKKAYGKCQNYWHFQQWFEALIIIPKASKPLAF
ncbi:hypothetical protein [Endozoicomonas sp. Mp262]|uniref:hypothetical protein n=1 Tax=Endozoicomonas sp. Mp262 TaxID=2919499 RepID=UPI0021D87B63